MTSRFSSRNVFSPPFWEDLQIPASNLFRPGIGTDPETIAWRGTMIPCFDHAEYLWFQRQMPHAYVEGSDFRLHLHWTPHTRGVIEAAKTVNWRVDMSIANRHDAFPVETTYDLTGTCAGVDHEHEVVASVTIPGAGLTISHMLVGSIYRIAGDTWTTNTSGNRPGLLELDLHYLRNSGGSNEEMVK
jgi:hypothetical protein